MFYFKAHLWSVVFLLTLLALLLGSGTGCRPSPKQTGPPEKVTIACTKAFNAALVHIAFAKGYFKEEGLEATPQPQAFGKVALQAMLEGKADLATAADTPIMLAIMDGQKIAIAATLQTANKDNAVVARKDRGIMKPSDLDGKTIAVTKGTTSDFFTEIFLLAHGIDRKRVTLVDLPPEEMVSALDRGEVDAAASWNPLLIQMQKALGNKGVTFYGEKLYTETFCLTASREFTKSHPQTIQKVLRAIIRAETYALQYPEEARRLTAQFSQTDQALLDSLWDMYTFKVTLDQALLVDLEDQTRWAIKYRMTKRLDMPNYLDYLDVDGLKAVKPEAVRIIQ
jgi:sulfonate transport system substrate-binding protein